MLLIEYGNHDSQRIESTSNFNRKKNTTIRQQATHWQRFSNQPYHIGERYFALFFADSQRETPTHRRVLDHDQREDRTPHLNGQAVGAVVEQRDVVAQRPRPAALLSELVDLREFDGTARVKIRVAPSVEWMAVLNSGDSPAPETFVNNCNSAAPQPS